MSGWGKLGGGAGEEKSLNMLLPRGRTAACDVEKQCRVMGIFVQVEKEGEGGGGGEKRKRDVRRRKHNRNINREGLRSASCYIRRWLCVLGLGGEIDLHRHCH